MNSFKKTKITQTILGTLSIVGLSACSSFGIDSGFLNSRTLNASQRMLLVTDEARPLNAQGVKETADQKVVCTEPSPDAMKALSFAETLNATFKGGLSAGESFALSQALGELGERNTTIQTIRELFYNSCGAYMNGMISPKDYQSMWNFIDVYSLTLLSIDNLTKNSARPATVISSQIAMKFGTDGKISEITPKDNPLPPKDDASKGTNDKDKADAILSILKNYQDAKFKFSVLHLMETIPALITANTTNSTVKTTLEKLHSDLGVFLTKVLGAEDKNGGTK